MTQQYFSIEDKTLVIATIGPDEKFETLERIAVSMPLSCTRIANASKVYRITEGNTPEVFCVYSHYARDLDDFATILYHLEASFRKECRYSWTTGFNRWPHLILLDVFDRKQITDNHLYPHRLPPLFLCQKDDEEMLRRFLSLSLGVESPLERRVLLGLRQADWLRLRPLGVNAAELLWIPQYPVSRCRLDIALPDMKLNLECDGETYHSSSEHKARDARRDAFLCGKGWSILRLSQKDIERDNFLDLIAEHFLDYQERYETPKTRLGLGAASEHVSRFIGHHKESFAEEDRREKEEDEKKEAKLQRMQKEMAKLVAQLQSNNVDVASFLAARDDEE